eukprot:CAMPEP_0174850128 /NCGR_PEP_ID=MMETSP1114-20130205/19057_1 /TAXON_ID=312471 /ORGANISM="Neobodo designis, Strain CCAP 1951/1" /LENGTH=501 /DNA_ID=CAMNT_0016084563 /DNA_START=47 /DNA_END=1552 /DNA_ORIENTATION=+
MPTPASNGYTAVYGDNAEHYDDVVKPPQSPQEGAEMDAVAATAVRACAFTRAELQALLKEADYGEKRGAYNAYFRGDGDGGHLCRACGLAIGMHGVSSTSHGEGHDAAATRAPDTVKPTVTLAYLNNRRSGQPNGSNSKDLFVNRWTGTFANQPYYPVEAPLHWRGTAWYARFLEFDGYDTISTAGAAVRWRCTLPHTLSTEDAAAAGGDARPGETVQCNATFVTKGFRVDKNEKPLPGAAADFSVLRNEADTIEKHFKEVHQLEQVAVGRWTTSLVTDFCDHPRAVADCMFCYWCPAPMCCASKPGAGSSFFDNLMHSAPRDPKACGMQAVTGAHPRDSCLCTPAMLLNSYVLVFAGHASVFFSFGLVGAILTMCGFPCNSDKLPPILCWPCYTRRRRYVKALGAPESACQTRAITVFCCPCSEVQQWRETVNSGVWPGLMCCAASEADKAVMAPSVVRERYSVGGEYGVTAAAGASTEARRIARGVHDRSGPRVAIAMK